MRGRAFLLLTASLFPWTAAGAQPLPPDPDPAALEVARLILAATPFTTRPVDVANEQRMLEFSLLAVRADYRPCDRANPECLAAARSVSREFGPLMNQGGERLRERILAYTLADRLPPEQLHRMSAFFSTPDGRAFVEAWRTLWQAAPSRERMRQIELQAQVGQPSPFQDAIRRFSELTADLPRTQEAPPAIVPPVPVPPPPPRR
jgi:hypothetical protein